MGKRVLITGGQGRLARALMNVSDNLLQDHTFIASTVKISNREEVYKLLDELKPHIIVNCAGTIPPISPFKLWRTNAIGATCLAESANAYDIRFVHISSDAVFSGHVDPNYPDRSYNEQCTRDPISLYGVTKTAGEMGIETVCPSALILRPAFRHDGPWPFPTAFTDAYRSSVWLSQLLPDMVSAILMPDLTGILHMGGPRRSVYDMAREVSPEVLPGKLEDFKGWRIGRDLTLDCGRWERVKRERGLA